jgi:N-acetylglucosamine repressor
MTSNISRGGRTRNDARGFCGIRRRARRGGPASHALYDERTLLRKINTRAFKRATRTTSRNVNRQIVLNLVREHQPISRADLARRMDVARGMVTPLVNELLAEGLIYEGATANASRGRKPRLLHIRSHDRLAIAVDIRFSGTFILLSDFSGREIALERFGTPVSPGELVVELTARIGRLIEAHADIGICEGIGVVVPGMVDRQSGTLLNAPTLGWRDIDLRTPLSEALGVPVHIERDAVACALSQLWSEQRNSADGIDNFVYVTVSDGVGTGLVVNGEVARGQSNTAGEFGHVPLSLDGPTCMCGARGCWEAYASNLATVARYFGRETSTREAGTRLRESGFSITDLIARFRSGDAVARAALEDTGRYLGAGIVGIIHALNPGRIVVGGEITAAWDVLGPAIEAVIEERALTATAAATPIIPQPAEGYPRLRGATALVVAPVFAAPRVG